MEDIIRRGDLRVLATESSCDVVISCVGYKLMAHRIILSIASPVLQDLLQEHNSQPTVIIFPDITAATMTLILDYIYSGQVILQLSQLPDFLTVSNLLKLKVEEDYLKMLKTFESSNYSKISDYQKLFQGSTSEDYVKMFTELSKLKSLHCDTSTKEDYLRILKGCDSSYLNVFNAVKSREEYLKQLTNTNEDLLKKSQIIGENLKVFKDPFCSTLVKGCDTSIKEGFELNCGCKSECSSTKVDCGLCKCKLEEKGLKKRPLPGLIPIRKVKGQKGLLNKVFPSPWTHRQEKILDDPRVDCGLSIDCTMKECAVDGTSKPNDSNNNIEMKTTQERGSLMQKLTTYGERKLQEEQIKLGDLNREECSNPTNWFIEKQFGFPINLKRSCVAEETSKLKMKSKRTNIKDQSAEQIKSSERMLLKETLVKERDQLNFSELKKDSDMCVKEQTMIKPSDALVKEQPFKLKDVFIKKARAEVKELVSDEKILLTKHRSIKEPSLLISDTEEESVSGQKESQTSGEQLVAVNEVSDAKGCGGVIKKLLAVKRSDDGATKNIIEEVKEKKYKCADCGKGFSQLRNYKYHRSIHDGTKKFSTTCPECGKVFNDRGYLSSHMKIHRDRKEYACQHCPKRFNQRVAYNMHLRIHTGVKPHVCSDCGKSFSRKMLLKQHQRVHTGERPYSCQECGKSFADRSNMSLHARLHTGVKPYSCTMCPKSFTKKHHLKTHMNFHMGIKPYSCQKCGLAFSQSSNMRTHYKKCILKNSDTDNT